MIKRWTAEDLRDILYPLKQSADREAAAVKAARASILADLEQLKAWWSAQELPELTQRVFLGDTVLLLFESDSLDLNPEPYQLIGRMLFVVGALTEVLPLDVATF